MLFVGAVIALASWTATMGRPHGDVRASGAVAPPTPAGPASIRAVLLPRRRCRAGWSRPRTPESSTARPSLATSTAGPRSSWPRVSAPSASCGYRKDSLEVVAEVYDLGSATRGDRDPRRTGRSFATSQASGGPDRPGSPPALAGSGRRLRPRHACRSSSGETVLRFRHRVRGPARGRPPPCASSPIPSMPESGRGSPRPK